MKTRQEVPVKFAISVIALIVVMILIAIFAPSASAQKALTYHQKLQKEYSYETRLKANQSFTLASAKDNLRTAKKNARKANKKNQRLAKVKAKREQIAAIKP